MLEAAWKAAAPAERDLWQGLAQIAVGLTHVRRGNARGAAALLRRGSRRVGRFTASAPHGIQAGPLARQAAGLAAQIDQNGLAGVAPDLLRFRLTTAAGPGGSGSGGPGSGG